MLKDKLGFLGSLIGGLFEFGWSIVTYFVLPVLASERVGPIAAIRRSSAIVRSKWGESIVGEARFGLLGILFFLQAALVFAAGLALTLSYGAIAFAGLGPAADGHRRHLCIGDLGGAAGARRHLPGRALCLRHHRVVPPSLDRDLVEHAFRPKG